MAAIDAETPPQIEILNLTWASVISTAAAVPLHAEGLLFGGGPVIDGFRLLGELGSSVVDSKAGPRLSEEALRVVRQQQDSGKKLLGWCSLQPSPRDLEKPYDLLAPERQLHEALQRTKGAVSDALVGCVVASRRKRVRGIFGQDAFCVVGPRLRYQQLTIRSMGTTTGKVEAAIELPEEALKTLAAAAESMEKDKELEEAIQQRLRDTDSSLPLSQLHQAQRAVEKERSHE